MVIMCDALLTPAGIKQTESQGHQRSQLQLGLDGLVGFGQQSIFLASTAVASTAVATHVKLAEHLI